MLFSQCKCTLSVSADSDADFEDGEQNRGYIRQQCDYSKLPPFPCNFTSHQCEVSTLLYKNVI